MQFIRFLSNFTTYICIKPNNCLSPCFAGYSSPLKRKHSPGGGSTNQPNSTSSQTHQSAPSLQSRDSTPSNQSTTAVIAPSNNNTTAAGGAPASSVSSHHPLAGGASSASHAAVSAQFVQEFHESVLQQTRQQRLSKKNSE